MYCSRGRWGGGECRAVRSAGGASSGLGTAPCPTLLPARRPPLKTHCMRTTLYFILFNTGGFAALDAALCTVIMYSAQHAEFCGSPRGGFMLLEASSLHLQPCSLPCCVFGLLLIHTSRVADLIPACCPLPARQARCTTRRSTYSSALENVPRRSTMAVLLLLDQDLMVR